MPKVQCPIELDEITRSGLLVRVKPRKKKVSEDEPLATYFFVASLEVLKKMAGALDNTHSSSHGSLGASEYQYLPLAVLTELGFNYITDDQRTAKEVRTFLSKREDQLISGLFTDSVHGIRASLLRHGVSTLYVASEPTYDKLNDSVVEKYFLARRRPGNQFLNGVSFVCLAIAGIACTGLITVSTAGFGALLIIPFALQAFKVVAHSADRQRLAIHQIYTNEEILSVIKMLGDWKANMSANQGKLESFVGKVNERYWSAMKNVSLFQSESSGNVLRVLSYSNSSQIKFLLGYMQSGRNQGKALFSTIIKVHREFQQAPEFQQGRLSSISEGSESVCSSSNSINAG